MLVGAGYLKIQVSYLINQEPWKNLLSLKINFQEKGGEWVDELLVALPDFELEKKLGMEHTNLY